MLPFITKGERERAVEAMKMTVEALHKEGCPYKGVLYGQFMLTSAGPRIIEFNSRFGDPEAMNVLPILQTDFVEVSESIGPAHCRNKGWISRERPRCANTSSRRVTGWSPRPTVQSRSTRKGWR